MSTSHSRAIAFLSLFAAAASAGAIRPALAQTADSTGAVFARVETGKAVYAPGETVVIRVFAVNASPDSVTLRFADRGAVSQADYAIDGVYRWSDGKRFFAAPANVTLFPGETRLLAEFNHTPADYKLAPGGHTVTGIVPTYARAVTGIRVGPGPSSQPFQVRGEVSPVAAPVGAPFEFRVTVINITDAVQSFTVDGCPVHFLIDGSYSPPVACAEFARLIQVPPGQSVSFGPDDAPYLQFDPHEFPLGPGRHQALLEVPGAGADTVGFAVTPPDSGAAALAGRVVFPNASGFAVGATMILSRSATDSLRLLTPDLGTRAGEQGWFLFARVPPGTWYLRAVSLGGTVTWYPGTSDPARAQPLQLGAGSYTEVKLPIDGTVPPPPSTFPLAGTVYEVGADSPGVPLAGAAVLAVATAPAPGDSVPVPAAGGSTGSVVPPGGARFTAITGADGGYKFDLPAGSYRLLAGRLIQDRYQYFAGAERFRQAATVYVPSDAASPLPPRYDFHLASLQGGSMAVVSGRVLTGADNNQVAPAPGVPVYAAPILPSVLADHAPHRAVTDSTGAYVVELPADTPYLFYITAAGATTQFYKYASQGAAASWVDVAPGDTTAGVDFLLHALPPPGNGGGVVEGTILRAAPDSACDATLCTEPAAGAIVRVTAAYPTFAPYEMRGVADREGHFVVRGLVASAEGLPYYVSAEYPGLEPGFYPGGVPREQAAPLMVYAGKAANAGRIVLGRPTTPPQSGFLAGRILDGTGHPVGNARVRAFLQPEAPEGRVSMALTGDDGWFHMNRLPAGASVLVAVDAEGFVPAYYPSAHRWQQAERATTGGPAIDVAPLQMTLARAVEGGPYLQAGRVRVATGVTDTVFADARSRALAWDRENLPGAFFYLVNALSESPVEIPVAGDVTGDNGSVVVTGLPAGTYLAFADRPGYQPAYFTVAGGAVAQQIALNGTTPAVLADIRLKALAVNGGGGSDSSRAMPGMITTLTNAPNPFRPQTVIRFSLEQPCPVTLMVFDYRGRLVRTLLDGVEQAAGLHELPWKGTDQEGRRVSAGVYFYRVTARGESVARKMVLLP